MESGPVVVGGVLYVTTPKNTYAIDAATCALRWKHTYDYSPSPPFDLKVNRGVAYLDGRLYRGANDGRVYALDARTGDELWNVVAADPSKGETFPAAPAAWNGLVFIGNAGGDNFGVTGRLMAFDAATGGKVWSTDLIAEHGDAGGTWPPETEMFPAAGPRRGPRTRWTRRAPPFTSPPATRCRTFSPTCGKARISTPIRSWRSMRARACSSYPIHPPPGLPRLGGGGGPALIATRDGRDPRRRRRGRAPLRRRSPLGKTRLHHGSHDHRQHRRAADRRRHAVLSRREWRRGWNGPGTRRARICST